MTREEAIKIIKIVLAVAEDFEIIVQGEEFTEEKCKEAVEMATEALEQEPCTDAISRKAVLDAIQKLNIPEDMCVFEIKSHIEVAIATLPPVNPAEKVGQWEYNPLDMCFQCSQCKCRCEDDYKEPPKYKYCPQCGAKMQEVRNESRHI